jgi:hypothetical protein
LLKLINELGFELALEYSVLISLTSSVPDEVPSVINNSTPK